MGIKILATLFGFLSFFLNEIFEVCTNKLLNIIMIKLAVKALGSSCSDNQSTLVLLATKALVKPPNDIINDAIPNHSIIFFALVFFVLFEPCVKSIELI